MKIILHGIMRKRSPSSISGGGNNIGVDPLFKKPMDVVENQSILLCQKTSCTDLTPVSIAK